MMRVAPRLLGALIFAIAGTLAAVPAASAAAPRVSITFPTDGLYRPGRFIPVRVEAAFDGAPAGAELEIAADGAIPTRLRLSPQGRAAGVVPLLIVDASRRAFWQLRVPGQGQQPAQQQGGAAGPSGPSGPIDVTFRRLDFDQALVGFATPSVDTALARSLFPDATIISPVRLDVADPVPGSAAAWAGLDAIVLDAASPRPDDARLSAWLAGGVVVAIRSPARPDARWPWKQAGAYWVLRHESVGPRVAVDDPGALAAVQGWRADWPKPFRVRVILYAVLFCLGMIGLVLACGTGASPVLASASEGTGGAPVPRMMGVRRVLAIAPPPALSIAACAAMVAWFAARSPVLERSGTIVVAGEPVTQRDAWRFFASATPAPLRVAWDGAGSWTVPIFAERPQRRAAAGALLCEPSGAPIAWTFELKPGLVVTLASRRIEPAATPVPAGEPPAALRETPLGLQLARAYRQRPMAGYAEAAAADPLPSPAPYPEHWPSLVAAAASR